MLHLTLSNGKVCVQHFKVIKEKANKCEYPVSGSVRFRPEQISAITDSVPEQWQSDCMITSTSLLLLLVQ